MKNLKQKLLVKNENIIYFYNFLLGFSKSRKITKDISSIKASHKHGNSSRNDMSEKSKIIIDDKSSKTIFFKDSNLK